MGKTWTLLAVALLLVALGVGLAACGEEETTEEARQQLITDLDAFKASFDDMANLTADSTVDDLKAGREEVQAAWDKVVDSAADVKEAEIDEVEGAWEDLAQSVDDLSGDTPLSEVLPSLLEEISALKTAYDDLYNGLK